MAAMQDHPPPPPDAAGIADPAAEAYLHRLTAELSTPFSGSNSELVLLLRQRPHAAGFPAAVTTALDDLEELYSEGSAPISAQERDTARRRRADQEKWLEHALAWLRSVSGQIAELAADLSTTNACLEATRASIRRTVAVSEEGSAIEASALVVSLVERLGRAQSEEAALVAAMDEMRPALEHLTQERDDAAAWALAEEMALEAHPVLPPSSKEEDILVYEAIDRYN